MTFVGPPRYLVFDIESGGTDTENDPIIQVFMATADSRGTLLDTWEWFIKPDEPISQESIDVHGFTNEFLAEKGSDPGTVLGQVRAVFLSNLDLVWVAYNLNFDLSIIDAQFRKYRISDTFGSWAAVNAILFDPLVVDRKKDKYRKGKRKLENVAPHYGVDFNPEEAHDARYDVAVTAQVAAAVKNKYGVPSNEQQRVWYREYAVGLQAYFDKSGKTEEDGSRIVIESDWPLRKVE